jgi:hypothetical protein
MNNGKGSKPRPYSVPYSQYSENWDNIFKKQQPATTSELKLKQNKNEKSNN